jgi:hypothetical protein
MIATPPWKMTLMSALLWFSFAAITAAQEAGGEIQGVTVDMSGAALPDVTLTIVNTQTNATRVVHSDTRGRFSVPSLNTGRYEVTAELAGFSPRRHEDLRVSVGETLAISFELRPATNAETITVAERPRALDPARSHAASLIDQAAVTHLPIKSRNVTDLVATTPAVTRDRASGALVIAGQPGAANTMSVDGGELIGFGTYRFSEAAIEEVRVDVSGYSAEYGRASGGVVRAVTRSGSNDFHGSALGYRSTPFGTPGDLDSYQAAGGVGGPISRDRHFFFATYDTLRRSQGSLEQTVFMLKTDHQLSGDDRLTFRYNDHDLNDTASTRSALAAITAVFGSHLVNDGRVHYAQARDMLSLNRFQVADTLTWVGAGHEIKAGFDAVGDDPSAALAFGSLARTTFESDQISQFIQDEWLVASALTVNVGVRHDIDNDWDPRLGMTWRAGERFLSRWSYGRFSSPLLDESVRQGNAGIEYEWMPKTTIGVTYFDTTAPAWEYRAISAEVARRFWQGTQFRAAYTRGRTIGRGGELPRFEPRHRFVTSMVYDTTAFADRFSGVVTAILTDWTVSGIYTVQGSDPRLSATALSYASFDPRVARNVPFGRGRTLSFILESYNLTGRPNLLRVDDPIYPLEPGQPEGRLTQVGVRLLF